MKPYSQGKIIVAMSGGVDSSVAAYLLHEQGYAIEGLFMKNWEEEDTENHCSAALDLADAQQVCDRLGIKLHKVNFAAEYWEHVFENFLAEYQKGRTPNPDILCNKEIKFKVLLDYALNLGATKIATGHYARIQETEKQFQLLKAKDLQKDQSYFLHALNQQQLNQSIFPLGDLEKTQVRAIAEKAGFKNHNKKDSTGICFIGERKFADFLARYVKPNPGAIETTDGKVLGEHNGLMFYTLGQRQGLKIGGQKFANEAPWYVIKKNFDRNVLIVGQGEDHPQLYANSLQCQSIHWINDEPLNWPLNCKAKIRYRQEDQACYVEKLANDSWQIIFAKSQRAITEGQSIVFYDGDHCLGGGVINM